MTGETAEASFHVPRPTRPVSPLVAFEFLTVLRLPRSATVRAEQLPTAQLWYPLVGLAIGLLVGGLDLLLHSRLPALTEAALLLVLLEGITGLLHLDSLADSADGLLCVASRERRLEIMRDSRTGAFGVATVAIYLLLVWSALVDLASPVRFAVLVLTPVCGRLALVAVSGTFRYARTSGMGTGFQQAARGAAGAGALAMAVMMAMVLLGPSGLLLLGATVGAALAFGAFASGRLGGVTGDVIGCGGELAQVVALVLAVALASQTWFRPWL